MDRDIGNILAGWDYAAGELRVRKISGVDGNQKIQIRMDLGLMQLEWTGRPDGDRPHDCDSLLDFYQKKKANWPEHVEAGAFSLTRQDCWELTQEAMQFYWRRISFFELKEFDCAEADADHNLAILEMCSQFAETSEDRHMAEQYTVFVTAHRFQARAMGHLAQDDYDNALTEIQAGIRCIEDLLRAQGRDEDASECAELDFLRQWSTEVQRARPLSEREQLQSELETAVEEEDFERAAQLRDRLHLMEFPVESS